MARVTGSSPCAEPSSWWGRERDSRVVAALQLLEGQCGLPLKQAALTVNLSESRLRHLLREALGTAPHRYLKHRRLLRARELSESTFLSVKEIALAAGFNDLSHFLRDYKVAFGETPSETRRRRNRFGQ